MLCQSGIFKVTVDISLDWHQADLAPRWEFFFHFIVLKLNLSTYHLVINKFKITLVFRVLILLNKTQFLAMKECHTTMLCAISFIENCNRKVDFLSTSLALVIYKCGNEHCVSISKAYTLYFSNYLIRRYRGLLI